MAEKHPLLNVLFPIGTLYPSEQGGPSNTVYWMAKSLTENGIQVVCIATDSGIPPDSVRLDQWVETDYGKVRYTRDYSHLFPVKLLWYSASALRKADVIHLTSLFYPPSLLLAMLAFWSGKTIIWSVRGNLEPEALSISPFKKRLFLFIIRTFLRRAPLFHVTSPAEARHTANILGEGVRIAEVPNYLELPPSVDRADNQAPPFFLYIGRIHPIKALDQLIAGLVQSASFMASDMQCKIVGRGAPEYEAKLKAQVRAAKAEHKIVFLPHTIGTAKQELYANAYFTLLLSHSENFGNVVIESLAQGTPVIASTGTPWQTLEKEKIGYWISNDPQSIAACLETLPEPASESYRQMRRQSLALAQSAFDVRKNIHHWIELYQSATKHVY